MLVWMLTVALWGDATKVPITETEIYNRLSSSQAQLGASGQVFLLDGKEKKVTIYDKAGKQVRTFGKAGKGPGEFTYPGGMMVTADALYIRDFGNNAMIQFDLDGNFVRQVALKQSISAIVKVKGGWFYGTWRHGFGRNNPGQLFWADDLMKEEVVLLDMRPKGSKDEGDGISIKFGEPMAFNPAEDQAYLFADSKGENAYLLHSGGQFKISVFSAKTRKQTGVLSQKWKRLPFNDEWGDSVIERSNAPKDDVPKQGGFKLTLKADFPEYFPFVRDAHMWQDRFYLWRWTRNPDNESQLIVLDLNGREIDPDLPAEAFKRIGGKTTNQAMVFTFDKEEEVAGFALCPLDQVSAFLKEHPVPVKESNGVMVFTQ